jgi:hypothetical protein
VVTVVTLLQIFGVVTMAVGAYPVARPDASHSWLPGAGRTRDDTATRAMGLFTMGVGLLLVVGG